MKKILGVNNAPQQHWVGDGFPVRSLFSYNTYGDRISPFLLLDYAGPMKFEPTLRRRGVGEHPHRGFETVTIVYQGEVAHRDSTGAGGIIGPGDVQWMTAASGILHDEFHSDAFTREGGTLEMVQLWVNLPARVKMSDPTYQTLLNADIPVVDLPDNAGTVRVIAGEYEGHKGPARTSSPLCVWDVQLGRDHTAAFVVPEGHTLLIAVLRGGVMVNDTEMVRETQFALLERVGTDVSLEANSDARILLLSGEPLNEPIAGYGPFVMNSEAEIRLAIKDFNSGQFGRITAPA